VRNRKYVLLVSVVLVCLLLLTLKTRGVGGAEEVIAWLATPVQTIVAQLHRSALAVWSTYREWKDLLAENRALREEVEQLRLESLQVRETLAENLRLRRLLALRERLPLGTVSGEVIAQEWSGWVRSLTVNRGRRDGIRRLTPVIVPDGLVGRVVAARANLAVIQLLNDPSSVVGALVQRTRTLGMVEGDPGGGLRFKFLARDGGGIRAGDLIVTSGLPGGLFPKGVPVGRIAQVEVRDSALFQFVPLIPTVDFARVEEVLLVTGESGVDLFPHFAVPAG
jgi:rod shape-determining protein MreC